jgi:hypothetical protein
MPLTIAGVMSAPELATWNSLSLMSPSMRMQCFVRSLHETFTH